MTKQIKYALLVDSDDEMTLIVEDGGVASCWHNGSHIVAEFYHDRITADALNDDSLFDSLSDSEISMDDYESKQVWDDEVVGDMLSWLYFSDGDVEFVKTSVDKLFTKQ